MQIPVIVEAVPGNGYRASAADLRMIVAEGATPEEALAQFKKSVTAKLRNGARLTTVDIHDNEHPWLKFAGMFDPNDPIIQEWLEIMQQQRDRDDEECE
jgi:hypothetical protein